MDKIDGFLKKLQEQSSNTIKMEGCGEVELGEILTHFAVACKKCGSIRIFVSWEDGHFIGEYTGYDSGQKLFKCLDCGNAASFWS